MERNKKFNYKSEIFIITSKFKLVNSTLRDYYARTYLLWNTVFSQIILKLILNMKVLNNVSNKEVNYKE